MYNVYKLREQRECDGPRQPLDYIFESLYSKLIAPFSQDKDNLNQEFFDHIKPMLEDSNFTNFLKEGEYVFLSPSDINEELVELLY